LIDDAVGPMRDQLDWRYEVQRVETAVGLADAGCGLTIVPRSNIELSGSKTLVGRLIKDPVVTCAFGLVTKRGVPLSPTAEAFRDLLRVQIAQEERRMKRIH
jgi:DNA-binding transcriptional LysR family regulator